MYQARLQTNTGRAVRAGFTKSAEGETVCKPGQWHGPYLTGSCRDRGRALHSNSRSRRTPGPVVPRPAAFFLALLHGGGHGQLGASRSCDVRGQGNDGAKAGAYRANGAGVQAMAGKKPSFQK